MLGGDVVDQVRDGVEGAAAAGLGTVYISHDAGVGFQLTLQTGIRAGEDVLMEADLAVGPCRVWLARPPRVEHLPSRWR